MRKTRSRLYRLSIAAASIVLLSAQPGQGQNTPVSCSAFVRNADGSWKVLAPVILHIHGRPLGPMVGSTLPVPSMPNSIELTKALARECGKQAIWPVAAGEGGR